MGNKKIALILLLTFCLSLSGYGGPKKIRIFVVSSYDRGYLWSQDTHKGFCAGLLDFKFLDNANQIQDYTKNDYLETEGLVIKKAWMDTKRKSTKSQIANSATEIGKEIGEFKPDLIFLGDDNAANYIGNQFIDTDIPVVFWGINGTPMKYGLLDSEGHPGHNITGIYQPGYYIECLRYLKQLLPGIKSFAVLSDDSETGRAKAKQIEEYQVEGKLPVQLVETVVTNSLSVWQQAASRLEGKVDAFFVVNHNTIKDDQGNSIDPLKIASWYLSNIKKPECTDEKQFVDEGMLLTADDSGFKQGYEAVRLAYRILKEGANPGDIPVRAPERGPIMVNRHRAKNLGIDLTASRFIEEFIDKSLALEKYPQ